MEKEIKKCLECQKELTGKKKFYCSSTCRKKWNYHHNPEWREKQRERMDNKYQEQKSRWKRLSQLTEVEKIHLQKIWETKSNNG